ncbi:hypothetical protein BGX30_000185 [Mortierella sp. GBA39]|nr:hypothetical protein BGX30_000185 [Mortierella sp. GBA39]
MTRSHRRSRTPEAKQPEEWDEEADGEWEAPEIDNSDFKAWEPKMMPNPTYKGEWKPGELRGGEDVSGRVGGQGCEAKEKEAKEKEAKEKEKVKAEAEAKVAEEAKKAESGEVKEKKVGMGGFDGLDEIDEEQPDQSRHDEL